MNINFTIQYSKIKNVRNYIINVLKKNNNLIVININNKNFIFNINNFFFMKFHNFFKNFIFFIMKRTKIIIMYIIRSIIAFCYVVYKTKNFY